ncbi:hypothetical protein [Acidisoma sp. S159]|uniref:hypothetical protein n=1 Tax=Acidisoma sp. S159 TaxID=1747225 RepID=UPI00131D3353|nr:hypothetical protein [Acidisoma sp. S159]
MKSHWFFRGDILDYTREKQVERVDAFALKNSDFNAFLFAEVGTELNGSTLTILSILARLGKDPWAEAARWRKLSAAGAIDCLAQSIVRMPLCPQSIAGARDTATQLILLLPTPHRLVDLSGNRTNVIGAPMWVSMALMVSMLVFGLAVNAMLMPKQGGPAASLRAQMSEARQH